MSPQSIDEIRREIALASDARLPFVLRSHVNDPRSGVRALVEKGHRRLERQRAERARLAALYATESQLRRAGLGIVAGIDEVGRGALAGPLTAAAVVLPSSPRLPGLDDSKRILPARREELSVRIRHIAVAYSIVHVESAEIDSIGIGGAVRRAMALALDQLPDRPDHVLIDGLPLGIVDCETAVVRGDSTVAAIAAASILAKVERDTLMRSLAEQYPEYGFHINKGYGTSEHATAIARFGLTPIHRRSFGPCGDTLPLF